MRYLLAVILIVIVGVAAPRVGAAPQLKVSPDHHFLLNEDGSPFFYLADTAWELFHRLNREDAATYLQNRAAKRFTVIQAVVLAEFDGLHAPNAYGEVPLLHDDPTEPNEKYFQHVDWIVNKANELNLCVAMLPTWGDKWVKPPGQGGIFTPENAHVYGQFIGQRYRDKSIIWILGGDRAVTDDRQRALLIAMAQGLRQGDQGRHLITMHPNGGHGSSAYFPEPGALDFDLWQNGHCAESSPWEHIAADYGRPSPRPVIDGEPLYEDHPICFDAAHHGFSIAADVRHYLYWDLFSGACGHTYGNHCIWQFLAPGRQPVNGAAFNWQEAVDHPGANQMQYGRALIESRPVLLRQPDMSLLASDPGAGLKRIVATRARDGSYGFVYIPASRTFRVNLDKISGPRITAWWYNPRTGHADKLPDIQEKSTHAFSPPDQGENLDWILVLDDASKSFPPPGTLPG